MGSESSELAGILDSDPAKLFAALVGDWLSLGTTAFELIGFIVERLRQRKKDRSSRSPLAAAERLIGGQGSLHEAQATFEAQHLLLIADAFCAAWAQCRDLRIVPYPDANGIQADLAVRFARCWQPLSLFENPDPQAQLRLVASLTGPPTLTPYYRMFWRAFTDPMLGPALIPAEYRWECVHTRDVYRVFESYFYGAYNAGFSSDEGASLRHYLHAQRTGLPPVLMRRKQVQDMAGWGNSPIAYFDGKPLAHSQLYVEPYACETDVPSGVVARSNFFDLLPRLLGTPDKLGHQVVVVLGDPGIGKSLAARELILRTAQRYLHASSTEGVPFPIYIQGSWFLQKEVREAHHISDLIRIALHAHGQRLRATESIQNKCFDPPTDDEPVLLVVDDLDATQLTKQQQRALFQALGSRDRKHQAVLFSRRASLDVSVLQDFEIPQVELQEFATEEADSQVQEWLARWNLLVKRNESLTQERIKQRDLSLFELSKRPILLRILAESWDRLSSRPLTLMLLFAEFTQQVVRFRLEPAVADRRGTIEDTLGHTVVAGLAEKRILPPDATVASALTWILARLAWESVCQSERGLPLTSSQARRVLGQELALPHPDAVLARICDEVLLFEEPSPSTQDGVLTFGHDSFRQYLAAIFWDKQLRRLRSHGIGEPERAMIEQTLCQGRLATNALGFEMLRSQLSDLSDSERKNLIDLGTQYLLRDDAYRESGVPPTSRKWLRESMLALACHLLRSTAIPLSDDQERVAGPTVMLPDTIPLRRLAAEMECAGQTLVLLAPCLSFAHDGGRVFLAGLRLPRACLDHARLAAANLRGVDLSGASMRGADLNGSDLRGANLADCDLRGADLRGADLRGADMARAKLDNAQLDAAHLERTSLTGASLRFASLRRTRLDHANLEGADVTSADLRESSLLMANLRRARLSGAKLREADLTGADLEDAKLNHARGTRVKGARAWLRGVSWDDSVLGWHPDSRPTTAFLAEQLSSGELVDDEGTMEPELQPNDSDCNQAG